MKKTENKTDWAREVKAILKSEMAKKSIQYEVMVDRLNEIGVNETVSGFTSKIHRGTFSAIFFVQCLKVLGCKELRCKELRVDI